MLCYRARNTKLNSPARSSKTINAGRDLQRRNAFRRPPIFTPDAQMAAHVSWTVNNPSVYLTDYGLRTACKESRFVIERVFQSQQWLEVRQDSTIFMLKSRNTSERLEQEPPRYVSPGPLSWAKFADREKRFCQTDNASILSRQSRSAIPGRFPLLAGLMSSPRAAAISPYF